VTAVIARLETILTANGYETDAGTNVFEWRDAPLAETELPAVVVRDTDDAAELTAGETNHEFTIELDIFAIGTATLDAAEVSRKVVADVVKAMGVDFTFGGLTHNMIHLGESAIVDQESRKLLAITVEFALYYTTAHFDPYN